MIRASEDLAVKAAQLQISPGARHKQTSDSTAVAHVPPNLTLRSFLEALKGDEQHEPAPLRFQAAAIDGGVDTSCAQMVYWADNLFVANCLQPYCSVLGKGISVLGACQAVPPKLDEEQEDYVLLLKQLLRVALKHILQLQQGTQSGCEGPYFPDSLSLSALEQVFVMTWQSYEASPALSMKRVVKEVAAELGGSAPDLYERAKEMVEDISAKYSSAEDAAICENHPSAAPAPPTPTHYNPTYQVFPHPSNPHIVMDARVMPRLLTQHAESAPLSVGVITEFEVNRKGGLSCPVRTGAVLACCRSPATSIMHGVASDCLGTSGSGGDLQSQASNGFVLEPSSTEGSVSETTREACAQALDELETEGLTALRTCDSFAVLKQFITAGKLPAMHAVRVHRSHSFFQGVTVEFDCPKHGFSKELRPLIWFQFFSSEEDKALQTWESSIMGAPEATPTVTPQATASSPSPPQPQKLPQDLQWVAEHYNPQQRAAELLADRRRSASVLSGASGLRSPGASQMATSSVQSSQQAAEGDSGDDAMHAPDDSESEWGSVSDGLVGEEEMAGVEDLWMEHLQCVHTHGRHKLKIALEQPCAANLISVVLTDQEVIEDLRGEEDDGEEPNIDISFVKFKGSSACIAPASQAWKELFN